MDRSTADLEETVTPAGALLDGEDPTSLHRDDPEHWVAVYTELVESTNLMLAAARKRHSNKARSNPPDADLIELEVAALAARAAFFTSRLRWWTERGTEMWVGEPELSTGDGDDRTRPG
jgi:hypothetical protein